MRKNFIWSERAIQHDEDGGVEDRSSSGDPPCRPLPKAVAICLGAPVIDRNR